MPVCRGISSGVSPWAGGGLVTMVTNGIDYLINTGLRLLRGRILLEKKNAYTMNNRLQVFEKRLCLCVAY